jgi:hypothetical protein
MQVQDIVAGESWGCRFRVTTFIDEQGKPVNTRNTPLGGKIKGAPGEYASWGVIKTRDTENRLLVVEDQQLKGREWTVAWDNVWDVDRVEYIG